MRSDTSCICDAMVMLMQRGFSGFFFFEGGTAPTCLFFICRLWLWTVGYIMFFICGFWVYLIRSKIQLQAICVYILINYDLDDLIPMKICREKMFYRALELSKGQAIYITIEFGNDCRHNHIADR